MRNTRLGLTFLVVFLPLLLNACAYTQHSLSPNNSQRERPSLSDAFCVMLEEGLRGQVLFLAKR
mgnify:CR=1 FL=1